MNSISGDLERSEVEYLYNLIDVNKINKVTFPDFFNYLKSFKSY